MHFCLLLQDLQRGNNWLEESKYRQQTRQENYKPQHGRNQIYEYSEATNCNWNGKRFDSVARTDSRHEFVILFGSDQLSYTWWKRHARKQHSVKKNIWTLEYGKIGSSNTSSGIFNWSLKRTIGNSMGGKKQTLSGKSCFWFQYKRTGNNQQGETTGFVDLRSPFQRRSVVRLWFEKE